MNRATHYRWPDLFGPSRRYRCLVAAERILAMIVRFYPAYACGPERNLSYWPDGLGLGGNGDDSTTFLFPRYIVRAASLVAGWR